MKFEPRPYQRIAGIFMLEHPRCALWLPCGLGKTSTTLVALQYLIKTGKVRKALVVAPLRVARSSWPAEVEKWDDVKLKISVCCGGVRERTKALNTDFDVLLTNYDNVQWLDNQNLTFDAVVLDEASLVRSYRPRGGGLRARAIGNIAKKAAFVWELTGTPASNRLEDVYGQIALLDGGERLGRSMTEFRRRYCTPHQVGRDRFAVAWIPRPGALEEVTRAVSDLVCAIKAEDFFALDAPIYCTRPVRLDGEPLKIYHEMAEQLFTQLQSGTSVEACSAAEKLTKCLQIADGIVYTPEGAVQVHTRKIEELLQLIDEIGEPVAVCYWWREDLARLLHAIPGSVQLTDDPKTLAAWNHGEIPVLLLHPASAGHGLNLQDGGRTMVFFSHGWSLELRQQAVERLGPTRQLQSGHPRPVYIYDIVCSGTVEECVMAAYEKKITVHEALMNGLRRWH